MEETVADFCNFCRICGTASDTKYELHSPEVADKLQMFSFRLSEDEGMPNTVCCGCFDKLTELHNFVLGMQRTEECLRAMLEASRQQTEDPSFNFLVSDSSSLCLEPPTLDEPSPEKPLKRRCTTSPSKSSKRHKRETICEKMNDIASRMKETEEINMALNLPSGASTSSGSILELISKHQAKPRRRIELDSSQTTICVCDDCNIMFSKAELLEEHRTNHSAYQCQICAANFNTPLILATHLKRNVHKIAYQDSKWTCAECFLVCKDKGSMLEHVRSVHTTERPFECDMCDRKFAVKRAFTLHVREHKQDWSHVCTYCGKGFLIKEYCEIHVRRYHTNERPFACDLCDARYPSKLQLSEHRISKHEGGRPEQIHACPTCGKKFRGTTSFKYHVRTHEMPLEQRRKFKCDACSASFIRKPALEKHMKRHRGEFEAFECHLCGKKLATSHGLELHLVVHSGEKNHVCEFCGKAFAAAGTLKVHIRSHTGEKPYQCKFCPKRFTQRSSIKMHMKNLHQYDDSEKTAAFPRPTDLAS